jgi:uncharacterized protein (DUF1800 family)
MISDRGYRPGFSGPAQPLPARKRRLIGRSLRPRLPAALLPGPAATLPRAASRAAGGTAAAGANGKMSPEQRLVQRATMGWSLAEQQLIDQLGYQGWLERQLDYESIDDSGLEEALAEALPSLAMTPAEILDRYRNEQGRPIIELIVAAIYRALYSPRQLFERMAIFWTDHFNIHLFSDLAFFLKPVDDREVVRVHAMGTFPELLSASAHSPAMLSYLTNDSNVKGAPNENYARELMELHTLGVDRGYTETDVKEVARCFTGWTYYGRFGGARTGRFLFNAGEHDDGEKVVLGHTIPAGGGIEDGERVLEILASHPNTARFVAEKLLRYFWRYDPPTSAINQVKNVYLSTGGDIRALLRSVLRKNRMKNASPKLKRPLHLMTSALRALGAGLRSPGFLIEQLFIAGHLPFNWAPPNGYPDSEGYWSGFVLPRWNFAADFLEPSKRSGVDADLSALDPLRPVAELVADIDAVLLNGHMSDLTTAALTSFLEDGNRNRTRVREAVGLAVGGPDFQEY